MDGSIKAAEKSDEGAAEYANAYAPATSPRSDPQQTRFFDLPPEIRNAIYELVLEKHFESIRLTIYKPPRETEYRLIQHLTRDPHWTEPTSHYYALKCARQPTDSLAIARVNKLIAAETVPMLYQRPFAFDTLGSLSLFLTTIKQNAKFLRGISIVGRFPYEDYRADPGFTQLFAATRLRSIQIPHIILCGDRKGQRTSYGRECSTGPRMSYGRTSVANFVRDIKPILLQLQKTRKTQDGATGVLEVVKVFKVEESYKECTLRSYSYRCNEGGHTGVLCGTDEMETLFQEVKSKLRASIAEALGIQES